VEDVGVGNVVSAAVTRRQAGKAARKRVKRGALGPWDPASRSANALSLLEAQSETRVPDLVPLRYARMGVSPWTYFRGAAAVMAADLATSENSGLSVQMCGDAHVLNFGLWATPERRLSFDLRDFDETLPGPFEWDVKRLAASLVIAARENDLPKATANKAVAAAVRSYSRRMVQYASAHELDIWYDRVEVGDFLRFFVPENRGRLGAYIDRKARRRTSKGAFTDLTAVVNGRRRIVDEPPFRSHIADTEQVHLVDEIVTSYRESLQPHVWHLFNRFTPVDMVRQVVGVGSVGMRVYLVLLSGRPGDDPLFLQVKQAGPSVYEEHLAPSGTPNHGARVVNGKRMLQTATDIFAGWTSAHGQDFYVRQFRDMKVIPDSQSIAPVLVEFASAAGEVLARAHARTGDAAAISGYIGGGTRFQDGLEAFAHSYADQNAQDHRGLVAAISAGSVASAFDS
jgi:uncharacterized protein (DUF2252 family)